MKHLFNFREEPLNYPGLWGERPKKKKEHDFWTLRAGEQVVAVSRKVATFLWSFWEWWKCDIIEAAIWGMGANATIRWKIIMPLWGAHGSTWGELSVVLEGCRDFIDRYQKKTDRLAERTASTRDLSFTTGRSAKTVTEMSQGLELKLATQRLREAEGLVP